MDGKNRSCDIIVNFAWFFMTNPSMLPMLNDVAIYIISARMKSGICAGDVAPNNTGASNSMIEQEIIKCTKVERNIVTRPMYRGTPFALYSFFMSLPYVSISDAAIR